MDNKESDDKKAETQWQEVLSKHCRALDLKRAVWDNKLFTQLKSYLECNQSKKVQAAVAAIQDFYIAHDNSRVMFSQFAKAGIHQALLNGLTLQNWHSRTKETAIMVLRYFTKENGCCRKDVTVSQIAVLLNMWQSYCYNSNFNHKNKCMIDVGYILCGMLHDWLINSTNVIIFIQKQVFPTFGVLWHKYMSLQQIHEDYFILLSTLVWVFVRSLRSSDQSSAMMRYKSLMLLCGIATRSKYKLAKTIQNLARALVFALPFLVKFKGDIIFARVIALIGKAPHDVKLRLELLSALPLDKQYQTRITFHILARLFDFVPDQSSPLLSVYSGHILHLLSISKVQVQLLQNSQVWLWLSQVFRYGNSSVVVSAVSVACDGILRSVQRINKSHLFFVSGARDAIRSRCGTLDMPILYMVLASTCEQEPGNDNKI